MPSACNYLLRFQPIFRRYLWGGTRLATMLHKPLGAGDDYAESWEVVDHGDDQSVVDNGALAGCTLGELVRHHGRELLGRHAASHPEVGRGVRARRQRGLLGRPRSDMCKVGDFLSAVAEISRLQSHALGAGAPQRRASRAARSARSRQDRGVGGGGRGPWEQNLCGIKGRRHPGAPGGSARGRRVRDLSARVRGSPGRLRLHSRRHGACAGRGVGDRRDPTGQRHNFPSVRLEPRRRRGQAAASAHRPVVGGH